jgi:formamidopyrimidine-DNA glycosylase
MGNDFPITDIELIVGLENIFNQDWYFYCGLAPTLAKKKIEIVKLQGKLFNQRRILNNNFCDY